MSVGAQFQLILQSSSRMLNQIYVDKVSSSFFRLKTVPVLNPIQCLIVHTTQFKNQRDCIYDTGKWQYSDELNIVSYMYVCFKKRSIRKLDSSVKNMFQRMRYIYTYVYTVFQVRRNQHQEKKLTETEEKERKDTGYISILSPEKTAKEKDIQGLDLFLLYSQVLGRATVLRTFIAHHQLHPPTMCSCFSKHGKGAMS